MRGGAAKATGQRRKGAHLVLLAAAAFFSSFFPNIAVLKARRGGRVGDGTGKRDKRAQHKHSCVLIEFMLRLKIRTMQTKDVRSAP